MKNVNITQAKSNLRSLVDETHNKHEPIHITGERVNAVLVSEKDWNAMQETLYINSSPELKNSILKGRKESLKKCSKNLNW